MSGRVSNADVIRAQEAQVETLLRMNRELIATLTALAGAVQEWMQRPQRSAVESVEFTRAAMGDHSTGLKVTAQSQGDETLEEVTARASAVFESRAARYPTANGSAHAAPLGPDDLEEKLRASVEGLRAVPEPEE